MKALATIRPLLLFLFLYCNLASAQSISGVVNNYYKVNSINTISNTLTLSSVTGLSIGTKILLIQMKGATINSANASTYGDISAINSAGNYEFNYICSINANDITLEYQILNTYDPTQQVQVVSIPVYSNVTVAAPLTASPWNPVSGTGGIVAIEATNTITLNSNIDVTGLGFLGGALQNYPVPPYDCSWAFNITDYYTSIPPTDQYHTGGWKGEGIANYIVNENYGRGKLASGGGGGNNNNTGGAGGANYGSGGNGGNRTNESFFSCHGTNPGVGGLSLSPYGYTVLKNRIFLGGGGGGGHENNALGMPGGNGGGIVILTANTVTGAGVSILAKGLSPVNPAAVDPTSAEGDGGGGGGAGGTVIINASTVSGSIAVQATGARGSDASNNVSDCTGPGGGGGGGVIWVAGASFPGAITGTVTGGANGVVSMGSGIAACRGSANGASSGTTGNAQTGYVAPMGSSNVCAILAASELKYFRGTVRESGSSLYWGLFQTSDLTGYQLESSTDRVDFSALDWIPNQGETELSYLDPRLLEGTVYYRLQLQYKNGNTSYSPVLALSRNTESAFQLISIQPNPVPDMLKLNMYAKKPAAASLVLYNAYGQRIWVAKQEIAVGYSTLEIPVAGLAKGAYMILIQGREFRVVRSFLKK